MTHPYLAGPRPRAFAHRGWHVGDLAGMENSLSSFRRAVQEGYRYIETDVHATADGHVVVHHDDTLDRTTDAQGLLASLPWTEVSRARVGGREPVARLADVLEELPGTFFNIDVKSEQAVEPIITLLRRTKALHRVCLASFSDARLARLRKIAGPELLTSLGPRSAAALWAARRLPLAAAAVRGQVAQVPVSRGNLHIVDHRFVQAAHRRSLEVHVWTIDDATDMHALLDLGVDGLVTDRPDVLREVLQSRNSW
ncbi:glycerophosphodiester phosphodiesterase [Lentzea sp. NBRC 102530]|uniref:glycerophosphodiester phosphodiesterase n=1 Tax=Lentzea sp. NBRC 102530 TaxID=3032201 RepID=UPI0024A124B8|nr:glycerophosphodiester phosphodiesterase [Lentzea sp. NBRC 102530]GLY50173.1 glycerophosphoryl diester phosphodiesterase [Lentzea sp. NBRC 102530]